MNRNPVTLNSSPKTDELMRAIFNPQHRDVDYDGARLAMTRMCGAPVQGSPAAEANRRRRTTMARIATEDAAARYEASRRHAARQNGYGGPLTRAEASAAQLAKLAGE